MVQFHSISLNFHQRLTTQLDLFQITELPQKRFQLIGFQALFLLKGLHHPTAWCHLPAFMRRSSLLDMDSADSCLSCCESVHFNKFSYNTLSIKASAWRSKTKERTVSRMKEPERLKEKTWTWHARWKQRKQSLLVRNSEQHEHATYINFETSSTCNGIWMRYNAVRWQQWYWRKWGPAPTSSDRSH